ncbi:hypothetical protein [Burkholderia diffusa]|uniref:hypothetical protein n=1 Tax=Burkholderia diffusa TaxID=488732 RepID=UPI002ABE1D72|nr:hypothetical protein [Burkholderia diffusa]
MNDAHIPPGRAITLSDKVAELRKPRSLKGRRSMAWPPRFMQSSGVANHDAL